MDKEKIKGIGKKTSGKVKDAGKDLEKALTCVVLGRSKQETEVRQTAEQGPGVRKMKRILAMLIGLFLIGSAFALSYGGGCEPVPTINVKNAPYNAVGDGVHDDAPNIQAAITAAGSGDTVYVPAGTYKVRYNAQGDNASLKLKSNMTFQMAAGAELKITANSSERYAVLSISTIHDVTVTGGTVTGDRDTHTYTDYPTKTHEWGMGVAVWNATNITIDGVTAQDCTGDGFYVDGINTEGSPGSHNVTVQNCTGDNNRRQGLSICELEVGLVTGNTFRNTIGTSPESGIDLEPWDASQPVTGVTISNNTCNNNHGFGIVATSAAGSDTGNTITGNTCNSNTMAGIGVNQADDFTVTGNYCSSNLTGIGLYGSTNVTVTNNHASNNQNDGILTDLDYNGTIPPVVTGNCSITGNTCSGNQGIGFGTGYGIRLSTGTHDCTATGNYLGNGNAAGAIGTYNPGTGNTTTPNYLSTNADTVDISILDTTYDSVDLIDLNDGTATPVSFTVGNELEIVRT